MASIERQSLNPGDLFIYTKEANVWVIGTVHEIDPQKGIMIGWVQKSSLTKDADIYELYPEGVIKIPLQDQGLSRLPDPEGLGK